jgi:hypothetical protein
MGNPSNSIMFTGAAIRQRPTRMECIATSIRKILRMRDGSEILFIAQKDQPTNLLKCYSIHKRFAKMLNYLVTGFIANMDK